MCYKRHFCVSLSVRAGTIQKIVQGETFTLTLTDHVEGRYVTLVLPGSHRILTVCEVEVYGYRVPTGENVNHYINSYIYA